MDLIPALFGAVFLLPGLCFSVSSILFPSSLALDFLFCSIEEHTHPFSFVQCLSVSLYTHPPLWCRLVASPPLSLPSFVNWFQCRFPFYLCLALPLSRLVCFPVSLYFLFLLQNNTHTHSCFVLSVSPCGSFDPTAPLFPVFLPFLFDSDVALPSKSGRQNNSHSYILLHMYLQHTPTISVLVSRRIKFLESILIPRLSSPQLINFSNKPIHYHNLGFCCNLLMTCSVRCVCDGFRAVH